MELTQDIAKRVFRYDPASGKLYWQDRLPHELYPSEAIAKMVNTRYAGKECSNVNKNTGYTQVVFQGRLYQVHRIIWLLLHGHWPKGRVDHKNRSRSDNLSNNLQDVTQAANATNRSDNTSGHPNIHHAPNRALPWRVTVKTKGVYLTQRNFLTLQEALHHRDSIRSLNKLPPIT